MLWRGGERRLKKKREQYIFAYDTAYSHQGEGRQSTVDSSLLFRGLNGVGRREKDERAFLLGR